MDRLQRIETEAYIVYSLGHTHWKFDKRDKSNLEVVLDTLYAYQAIGTVEHLTELKSELDTAKAAICQMCRKRGEEQHILCACVSCKYGGGNHGS